ncbi:cell envelope protein SmpA [Pseudomonas sp. CCI3.2]|uniref:cell envelope protein SmpA n=1 Tax=unclassified Pseudomonas TaxID=196821 RepID=UPI002AC91AAF|nr:MULTISPECIES: cell envelope protein SmpA [unclassified Pseudomonas]MEB0080208.1 cell envelope protein SmpA [Pseudomonas sp. MH10out]MEB0094234.1 cell envelope protein SmpA [Pseudomonas sp. CCI4.2]MEB0100447.1 cell envelope protein SmpA [Pseudomonas sp. CCI3.2]MEB0132783.1 cell envelope protein SmpA [Pseudomonas sp. CCI2.4]MEB0160637.1 cell envelope protein SmpA [Pseudomonas sp. AH2 (2023)]
MLATARTTLIAALLSCAPSAPATTVQRCEDPEGRVSFTYHGCPDGHRMQSQNAYNPTPGSTMSLLPEAEPFRDRRVTRTDSQRTDKELVVVGRHDDGCGNVLSSEQRRRAIIQQQIRVGMTLRDVESSLGKPDKVVSRNGETRYTYEPKNGRSSQVVFDEEGCVKGKR